MYVSIDFFLQKKKNIHTGVSAEANTGFKHLLKKITINFNLKSKTLEVSSMNTTCCSIIGHLHTFFGNIR